MSNNYYYIDNITLNLLRDTYILIIFFINPIKIKKKSISQKMRYVVIFRHGVYSNGEVVIAWVL
jgi:hypothetical protein